MIAILGGGIAGASLARSLAVRGRRDVVIFDPMMLGGGSTGRAFGGFRTQFASALNIELSLASREFFVARAGEIRFNCPGYLILASDPRVAAELDERASIQIAAGLPIEHPDPRDLVPFLCDTPITKANFCRLDGVYDPMALLQLVVEEARDAGVDCRYGCRATAAEVDGATIVIAAGIWSAQLANELGVDLAVEAVERVVFELGPVINLPSTVPVVIEAGEEWAFRERGGSLLVVLPGSTCEREALAAWANRWAPSLQRFVDTATHWTGFYEMTSDHHPFVGQTERPDVWASCGFSGHGVMHSPAIADNLAAMMLGDTPAIDLGPLSPLRTEPLVDATQV